MSISYERLQGNYLRDILNQPQAMRDTIAAFEHIPALDTLREQLRSGQRRRIVLTGMGGSYQVLQPLYLQLAELGFDSVLVETSELLYSLPSLLRAENVVVTLSQSGASAEIVRLLDNRTPFYVGVSNTPASPLASRADITILTQAGDEAGVSCKTAVTSVAALHWLSTHLAGGDLSAALRELETLPGAMEGYISRWRDHVAQLVESLSDVRNLFFAGRGASLAAAGLGAMVQKEAAHFQGEGLSSAALRHGPFEMLSPTSFVVVFEGAEIVRELNLGLVRDVLDTGARGVICGVSGDGPFQLPDVPGNLRPIVELLPPQMVSLALAYNDGREPGKFERITKVTTVE